MSCVVLSHVLRFFVGNLLKIYAIFVEGTELGSLFQGLIAPFPSIHHEDHCTMYKLPYSMHAFSANMYECSRMIANSFCGH